MGEGRLREIVEQMKGKEIGSIYDGVIPDAIRKIRKISTKKFDYIEIVFQDLEYDLLKKITDDFGLKHEKKGAIDSPCERCLIKEECISEKESSDAYTIIKPKKFFPIPIADVVYNSIRVYITRDSLKIGSEIIDQYLEKIYLHR